MLKIAVIGGNDTVIGFKAVGLEACSASNATEALQALRDLGVKPKHRLVTFIGSNEESGMADAAAFAREQPLPVVSLVPPKVNPGSYTRRTS